MTWLLGMKPLSEALPSTDTWRHMCSISLSVHMNRSPSRGDYAWKVLAKRKMTSCNPGG